MLSNMQNGCTLQWKCHSKYLTQSELNIINEFKKSTVNGYYNLSLFNLCENHLIFDTFFANPLQGVCGMNFHNNKNIVCERNKNKNNKIHMERIDNHLYDTLYRYKNVMIIIIYVMIGHWLG